MTEYEINKEVAKKAGINNPVKYDPCNNAQQAWDIMLTNNISITKDGDGYYAIHNLYHICGGEWCVDNEVYNENPFVAAMLLFLEI